MKVLGMVLIGLLTTIWMIGSAIADGRTKDCERDTRLCYTKYCNISICSVCNGKLAICTPTSPENMVPHEIQKSTHKLIIVYDGPQTSLTQSMFSSLINLQSIHIAGENLTSIETGTFAMQTYITLLVITKTQISSLPKILFSSKNQLKTLLLNENKFESIPVAIFSNIGNVRQLDLSYNPLSCKESRSTISKQFTSLSKLTDLALKGYGAYEGDKDSCKDIDDDYLKPLAHIQKIDLSESLLFHENSIILSKLKNLSSIVIDSLMPFKACPATAKKLFLTLPRKVSSISIRNWATLRTMNHSCILNETSMQGISKLNKVSMFDASGSDNIFGLTLQPEIFKSFRRTDYISMKDCGIAMVKPGTFNHLDHVNFLSLSGNRLGPRDLQLYTGNYIPKLKELYLDAIGIGTIAYNLTYLLKTNPALAELTLNDNNLKIVYVNQSETLKTNIQTLQLNENLMSNFAPPYTIELCHAMPNLTTLSLVRNYLEDVTGICKTVENLNLRRNRIWRNLDKNYLYLATLYKLKNLELSENEISYISVALFDNMPHLEVLSFSTNKLHIVTSKTFSKLKKLKRLDLSSNNLGNLPDHTFSMLESLELLYLYDNHITELSSQMIDVLKNGTLTNFSSFAIYQNPLICSCDNKLKNWILRSGVVLSLKTTRCHKPENRDEEAITLITYDPDEYYCFLRIPFMIVGSVLASALISLLLGIPCYKYRWYLTHLRVIANKLREVKLEHQCVYDAFISYDTRSVEDTVWVKDILIPALEGDNESGDKNMKLYVADRDAGIGDLKQEKLCEVVETSRKIFILLTNSYLDNAACLQEADLISGYNRVNGEEVYQTNRIIVLILEDINEATVKQPITALLTGNTIDMVSRPCKPRIWKRLRNFASKPKYIYPKSKKSVSHRAREATPGDTGDVTPVSTSINESDPLLQ